MRPDPNSPASARAVVPLVLLATLVLAAGCAKKPPEDSDFATLFEASRPPLADRIVRWLAVYAVLSVVFVGCLWIGMKLTRVIGTFRQVLPIAAIVAASSFIPFVGGLVAVAVTFVLVERWLDHESYAQVALMAVVSNGISYLIWLGVLVTMH